MSGGCCDLWCCRLTPQKLSQRVRFMSLLTALTAVVLTSVMTVYKADLQLDQWIAFAFPGAASIGDNSYSSSSSLGASDAPPEAATPVDYILPLVS